eukprot:CAMPEP_0170491156 /NCGR_PEP_ID=MMETSP0208-20121228/10489_1 /TAXON_ID=197538 /ORGANISM="Strombidium inclinatum, Strain S3" /LENGTH=218 /DNA_ID=CAMNT_0010766683 /DNA_START=1 /DNA_END=658 /DNA_ORIENTATION=+
MKFIVAALIGLATLSEVEQVQALQQYRHAPSHALAQNESESDSESESSSSSDSEEDVATAAEMWGHPVATKWDKEHPHPGYEANHDDFEGMEGFGNYDRQVPNHFQGAGSGDDQFMNSMITKYAVEESTNEGKPTGKFFFRHANAKQAAYEIVETHLGLKGKAAQDYLDQNFDKTFKHFDTAADGKIEADRMSASSDSCAETCRSTSTEASGLFKESR